MTKRTRPKKKPKTPGGSTIAKQPEAMKRIAGELRELYKKVKKETAASLAKTLNEVFIDAGRLLMEAGRAGAFPGDAMMRQLIDEHMARWKGAHWHGRTGQTWLEFFLAVERQWLPVRCPPPPLHVSSRGGLIRKSPDTRSRYLVALEKLADLIDADAQDASADVPKAERVLTRPNAALEREDLEQLKRLHQWFEEEVKLLEKGERAEDTIDAAFMLWTFYPHLLELIGRNFKVCGPMPAHATLRPESPEVQSARTAAYYVLENAYTRATHFLMLQAKKYDLDPHPLYECGRVVQEIYAHEPWKCYAGRYDTWPDCMGDARYTLPTGQQDALRAGEAVFIRLAVALEIADAPDMDTIQKAVTGKLERRSAAVTGGAVPLGAQSWIGEQGTAVLQPGGTGEPQCSVVLADPDGSPKVFGKTKPVLSPRTYAIIKVMVELWPNRDSWENIARVAKRPSATAKILRDLRIDSDWKRAILMAKKPHGGYGLAPSAQKNA